MVEEKRRELDELCRRHHVRRFELFGSAATGRFDPARSDLDFLCRVVERVIDAGATTINLPDTVGFTTPDEIRDFFVGVRERVPNADKAVFSTHCHDDLAWRWPTRSRRCRGASGRWSAP